MHREVGWHHSIKIEKLMHKKYGYVDFMGEWVPGTERKYLPVIPSDGSVIYLID